MSQLRVEGVVENARREGGSAKEGKPGNISAQAMRCTNGPMYIVVGIDIAAVIHSASKPYQPRISKLASCYLLPNLSVRMVQVGLSVLRLCDIT